MIINEISWYYVSAQKMSQFGLIKHFLFLMILLFQVL